MDYTTYIVTFGYHPPDIVYQERNKGNSQQSRPTIEHYDTRIEFIQSYL